MRCLWPVWQSSVGFFGSGLVKYLVCVWWMCHYLSRCSPGIRKRVRKGGSQRHSRHGRMVSERPCSNGQTPRDCEQATTCSLEAVHGWSTSSWRSWVRHFGDVYGVGLQDEDEDTDDEGLDQPGEDASSSSSHLPSPPAVVSTSSNLASQLVFMYDVDEAVVKAIERGSMHEWTHIGGTLARRARAGHLL